MRSAVGFFGSPLREESSGQRAEHAVGRLRIRRRLMALDFLPEVIPRDLRNVLSGRGIQVVAPASSLSEGQVRNGQSLNR